MNFLSIVTRIGAVLGAIVLVIGFSSATGAPQEAAVAALAIALAVIPYVMYRVLQLSKQADDRNVFEARMLKSLEAIAENQEQSKSSTGM